MTQESDNQYLPLAQALENLRFSLDSIPEGPTAERYSRALTLFASFLGRFLSPVEAPSDADTADEAEEEDPSFVPVADIPCWRDSIVADWMVDLWLSGTPLKTAILYLDIISSLFGSAVKEGLCAPTKAFSRVKAALKSSGESLWSKGIDDEVFSRALLLTKSAPCLKGATAVAADLLLYSLITGGTPVMEVAMLTRGGVSPDPEAQAIATRRLDGSRRQYVFPLQQSEKSRRQVSLAVQRLLSDLFRSRGLPVADNVADTVESLWAYAALRCGASASEVVAIRGHVPAGIPVLALAESRDVSPARRTGIDSQVASVFLVNPLGWYAMSMRPGVRYSTLDSRIKAQQASLPPVTLFYPCEEISRIIKKKVVLRSRPFISAVVFFRTRPTDIVRIFSRIGDLAWCYTTTGRPGAPYARIARVQFERFQQTIARFTPDYEVADTGALPLRENDRVKVVGGIFSGKQGEFKNVAKEEDNVVYRIQFVGDNGIDWRVSIDPRLIQPAP